MISLAAAAAVTERIRLATTILIAPYRVNATIVAKQAASISRISGGRMVLGTAVGGREDDYRVSGADFESRGGENFDGMLGRIREVWDESNASSGAAEHEGVGPDVAEDRPELMVGGSIDAAFRRAAEYGDGWIMGGGTPEMFAAGKREARACLERRRARRQAAHDGARLLLARRRGRGQLPTPTSRTTTRSSATWRTRSPGARPRMRRRPRAMPQGFGAAGCDELIMFPSSSHPDQVDCSRRPCCRGDGRTPCVAGGARGRARSIARGARGRGVLRLVVVRPAPFERRIVDAGEIDWSAG